MTPVQIALTHSGIPEVKNALKSVRDTIVQLEVDSIRAAQAASKKRLDILKAETEARKKIAKDMQTALGGSMPSTKTASVGTVGAKKDTSFLSDLQQHSSIAKSAGNGLQTLGARAGALAIGIGALAAGISLATEGLKQFGGFLVNDVVKPAFALETFATQLENATFGSLKANDVMAKGREMQVRYNLDAKTAAEAIGELADKTGNAKLSFELIDQLAALSKGYGVDMGQLSGMAGAVYSQDKNMSAADIGTILRTQLAQGASGSITLKELAGLGGSYTANMAKMAGNVDVKAATIGAAMQTGGITGKADVSIGNINSFISEVGTVAKKQRLSGVLNDKGQVADLGTAIRETLMKSKGNLQTLGNMGFSKPAQDFIVQYESKFQEGMTKFNGDLQKAAQYATEDFEKMRTATLSEAETKKAAARVMQTSGEKMEQAFNQIKMRMTEAMPQIKLLVDALASKAPALASAALTLTNVFIAAAETIAKLIPETDTRFKRNMQAGIEGAKIESQMAEKQATLDSVNEKIAAGKAAGQDTSDLEKQKASLTAEIAALTEQKKKVDAQVIDEKTNVTQGDVDAARKAAQDAMVKGGRTDDGLLWDSHMDISAADTQTALDAIAKDPKGWDVRSGALTEGYSEDAMKALEKYRDLMLQMGENKGKDGDKGSEKLTASADSLNKAADALQDAADAMKNSKEQPVGDR